ncbi:hypothetical protein NBH19_04020 [Rhizobium sp. S95]|uniref:Uncharacterized protein n=1 Tax=Ciceribacter sichuanensis TaxID=2949647 RepID=A0AAJ1F6A6_9HYPH|nr:MULTISPECIES: hypothetical protein [unclassified Ciceribacter]MCM2395251.1 hypothetical protein [Ciceribacter sp. S95]MCM2400386.1 hypothetical protein [Ciceribacter sp. S153]MCO5955673.1 hypothetical protein [Ciceribacter sp. S101]
MASLMVITGLAAGLAVPSWPYFASDATTPAPVLIQSQDDSNRARTDCRAAAARAVSEVGGQLLSVRQSGGQCIITVLVPGSGNERPRKVTMQVSE